MAITDVFFRRYGEVVLRDAYREEDRRLLNQCSKLIAAPLWEIKPGEKPSADTEVALKTVHKLMADELGVDELSPLHWFYTINLPNGNKQSTRYDYAFSDVLAKYLNVAFADGLDPDEFIKRRLSVVEIAFQNKWKAVQRDNSLFPEHLERAIVLDAKSMHPEFKRGEAMVRGSNQALNAAFDAVVHELNERLRLAGYPLTFHNGLLQFTDDELVEIEIAEPFWALVRDPLWKSVDEQMKEALDRRDKNDRTAPFHSASALESCIKIISDEKHWTRGNEKGAAHYIDNLVSAANGRFIDVWEAEMLKAMFSDVRNPFGHGPGAAPLPNLKSQQDSWVIDTSMAWIKSLITRM